MTITALPRILRSGGLLPVDPFRELVQRDAIVMHKTYGTVDETGRYQNEGIGFLSVYTGIPERTIARIANGSWQAVTLDVADKYLCATGRHLRDVWPWLYTDEQIEADIAASEAARRALEPRPRRRQGYVETSHGRSCSTRRIAGCDCKPRYGAYVWRGDTRTPKWFACRKDAEAWVAEWKPA